ncbi:hypothetical protein ACFXKR_41415 [Streptomyces violascens]|uniref:hypothetical protein n=1 Tax=Streptomyces violascens TaxID=67381 RepID=UPI0036AB4231
MKWSTVVRIPTPCKRPARAPTVVPRRHTEHITIAGQDRDVRLGVCLTNQKARRGKLDEQQLAQVVADLGIDWA